MRSTCGSRGAGRRGRRGGGGRTEDVVAGQVGIVELLHRVVDAHWCCATSAASSSSEAASRGAASGRVGVCACAASGVAASHAVSVSVCCAGEGRVVGASERAAEMSSGRRRRRRRGRGPVPPPHSIGKRRSTCCSCCIPSTRPGAAIPSLGPMLSRSSLASSSSSSRGGALAPPGPEYILRGHSAPVSVLCFSRCARYLFSGCVSSLSLPGSPSRPSRADPGPPAATPTALLPCGTCAPFGHGTSGARTMPASSDWSSWATSASSRPSLSLTACSPTRADSLNEHADTAETTSCTSTTSPPAPTHPRSSTTAQRPPSLRPPHPRPASSAPGRSTSMP